MCEDVLSDVGKMLVRTVKAEARIFVLLMGAKSETKTLGWW